jgi:hypothetical protein
MKTTLLFGEETSAAGAFREPAKKEALDVENHIFKADALRAGAGKYASLFNKSGILAPFGANAASTAG